MRFLFSAAGAWILFFSMSAFGQIVTEQRIQEKFVALLAQARSPQEIERIQSEFDELKIARTACKLQIQSETIPVACYDSLFLHERWRLSPSAELKTSFVQQMDELCVERAARLAVHPSALSMPYISSKCREQLITAREIQSYREKRTTWSDN